jgi:hypothetical protein
MLLIGFALVVISSCLQGCTPTDIENPTLAPEPEPEPEETPTPTPAPTLMTEAQAEAIITDFRTSCVQKCADRCTTACRYHPSDGEKKPCFEYKDSEFSTPWCVKDQWECLQKECKDGFVEKLKGDGYDFGFGTLCSKTTLWEDLLFKLDSYLLYCGSFCDSPEACAQDQSCIDHTKKQLDLFKPCLQCNQEVPEGYDQLACP